LVPAAKFLVEATKNTFVVPNFVAVTRPFFSVLEIWERVIVFKRHMTLALESVVHCLLFVFVFFVVFACNTAYTFA